MGNQQQPKDHLKKMAQKVNEGWPKLDRSIPSEFLTLLEQGTSNTQRLGQFFHNFHHWVATEKCHDPFYVENHAYCTYLKEYISDRQN